MTGFLGAGDNHLEILLSALARTTRIRELLDESRARRAQRHANEAARRAATFRVRTAVALVSSLPARPAM